MCTCFTLQPLLSTQSSPLYCLQTLHAVQCLYSADLVCYAAATRLPNTVRSYHKRYTPVTDEHLHTHVLLRQASGRAELNRARRLLRRCKKDTLVESTGSHHLARRDTMVGPPSAAAEARCPAPSLSAATAVSPPSHNYLASHVGDLEWRCTGIHLARLDHTSKRGIRPEHQQQRQRAAQQRVRRQRDLHQQPPAPQRQQVVRDHPRRKQRRQQARLRARTERC